MTLSRGTLYCVLSVLGCADSSAAHAQAAQQRPAGAEYKVQAGISLSSDTVTIGEPFEIRVRIRAPIGATIRFPDNPDTTGAVQARDPRVVQTSESVQWLDQTASYHVAAWNVGRQLAVFGDVVVMWNTPASRGERRVPLANVGVFVRGVLPADSALRVPKPARPLWETRAFPWWLLALAAVALGLALWWWLRRRKRPVVAIAPAIDPYDRAAADFARIEAMGLVDAGERTRFVSLVIEVLRDYLAARYPDARLALTSRELLSSLRRRPAVTPDALARVLHDADLAKFAGLALAEDRARAVARDARAIVDREHAASQPRPVAQAAA